MIFKLLVETIAMSSGITTNLGYPVAINSIVLEFDSRDEANTAFDHINMASDIDHCAKVSRQVIKLY